MVTLENERLCSFSRVAACLPLPPSNHPRKRACVLVFDGGWLLSIATTPPPSKTSTHARFRWWQPSVWRLYATVGISDHHPPSLARNARWVGSVPITPLRLAFRRPPSRVCNVTGWAYSVRSPLLFFYYLLTTYKNNMTRRAHSLPSHECEMEVLVAHHHPLFMRPPSMLERETEGSSWPPPLLHWNVTYCEPVYLWIGYEHEQGGLSTTTTTNVIEYKCYNPCQIWVISNNTMIRLSKSVLIWPWFLSISEN